MSKKMAEPEGGWTLSSEHHARYGSAGFSHQPVAARCAASVEDKSSGMWPRYYQCSKPRGYGPEGAYCAIHSPDKVKARREARTVEWRSRVEEDARKARLASAAPDLLAFAMAYEQRMKACGGMPVDEDTLDAMCLAAIAKATGEQP